MDKKTYEKMTRWIKERPKIYRLINIINKFSTRFVYIIYPIFLIKLFIDRDINFWKILTIPAISFLLLSFFRKKLNLPRPYEVFGIMPAIKKDTKGKSFPSRHVFSVFVIASSIYYISNSLGIVLMLVGLIIAIIRVLGGVHFPRDVIAASIIGVLASIVGWNIFPF